MKNILLVENYDSFSYNVVQGLGMLGAQVTVARNDKISVRDIAALKPDGIVVSPGPCSPAEAGISVEVIKTLAGKIPILGICLGHQCIGAAFGGNIIRARKPMHGKTSVIKNFGNSVLFKGLPERTVVGRYHSLVIEFASLSDDLEITAISTDDNEIMAVRHKKFALEGVQFHPESILTPEGVEMLENFLTSLK